MSHDDINYFFRLAGEQRNISMNPNSSPEQKQRAIEKMTQYLNSAYRLQSEQRRGIYSIPRKIRSQHTKKVSNKVTKRVHSKTKTRSQHAKKIKKTRKARKDKGVKRGPRKVRSQHAKNSHNV